MFEFDERAIEEARGIISNISFPEFFGADDDEFDDEDLTLQLKSYTNRKFYVYHGVTKVVIDFYDFSFVIKIPFDGWWDMDEFVPFEYAPYKETNNYCGADYEETLRLEKNGFGGFAPRIIPFGIFENRVAFAQEKIIPYWDGINSIKISQNSKDKAEDFNDDCPFATNWIAAAIEIFGEEKCAEFFKWSRHEVFINDMHCGNYGFTKDGRPIIFDLSGYYEN